MIAAATEQEMARRRRDISPRYSPPPTPLASRLIHGAALMFWVLLFARAFGGGGLFAWSAGLAYIAYDTVLIVFVFWQTLALLRPSPVVVSARPATTILIAARNEAAGLPRTIAHLLAQDCAAARIIIVDDGSTDGTAERLGRDYGLMPPGRGTLSAPSPVHPPLHWLRLPSAGKARALNAACALVDTELVLTIDADTLLEPGALGAMADAFAVDPALVAATGVLTPLCGPSVSGRLMQWFQTYEYVRNFLSRYAWMQMDGLLLISGAFGCYRRAALVAVGGFDPDCLVEDYELTHRLRDHAVRTSQVWRTGIVGRAFARTDAPGTPGAFLRQRRRWFGGFLQTQLWYRHMVGNARYGRLGTMMLPVKAIDTLQPLYGLTGAVLLLAYLATGQAVVGPIAGVIVAKIALDLAFFLWSLHLYRRWVGPGSGVRMGPALLAAIVEPFTFQLLRHMGAALGWVSFLTGGRSWGATSRLGIAPEVQPR